MNGPGSVIHWWFPWSIHTCLHSVNQAELHSALLLVFKKKNFDFYSLFELGTNLDDGFAWGISLLFFSGSCDGVAMGGREPGKGNPKSLFGGESGGAYENKQKFIIMVFLLY